MKNPFNDEEYIVNDEQIQDLKDALSKVMEAARMVLDSWSSGDLAGAVRIMDSTIKLYECEEQT